MPTRTVTVFDNAGNVVETYTVEIPQRQVDQEDALGRLTASFTTLRQWAADAVTVHADWPTKTNAQKDAINREVIRRLGILCDGLADYILRDNLDGAA